jgi:hypothetical protein
VTVFPQGAEVTRIAEARITAGEHTLIFEDLPAELAPETLRVEGAGGARIEIGAVDSRLVSAALDTRDEDRKRIEKDIEALNASAQASARRRRCRISERPDAAAGRATLRSVSMPSERAFLVAREPRWRDLPGILGARAQHLLFEELEAGGQIVGLALEISDDQDSQEEARIEHADRGGEPRAEIGQYAGEHDDEDHDLQRADRT